MDSEKVELVEFGTQSIFHICHYLSGFVLEYQVKCYAPWKEPMSAFITFSPSSVPNTGLLFGFFFFLF